VSKTFWTFLAVGLIVVAVGIELLFVGTAKNHLDLTGQVLKVRTVPLEKDATYIVADFRVKNPSNIQFDVKNIEITIDPASGEPLKGTIASKADVDTMFQYQKLIGPKFNSVLGMRDKINGGTSGDYMVAARFEVPENTITSRKAIHLQIEDLDGAIAEISGP
jgi:hypothetical protein